MRSIIINDRLMSRDPICPTVGCSFPIKYVYCDCTQDNSGSCDRTCESDDDCQLSCGCDCISKNEVCRFAGTFCEEPEENPSLYQKCICINNRCELKWEEG
ncbi:MAG: hypothetical protein ABIE55_04035 [Candidatus Aenigmatarchaeota archaeon]